MEGSGKEETGKKKVNKVQTFHVPFSLEEIKKKISITTNTASKPSKEQIINKAIKFHLEGNIQEASKYYEYCLDQGFNDQRIFSNYGVILKNIGKLKEAEINYRKAIEVNPDFASAHFNLGNILINLGRLQEAKVSTCKAIELNPDNANFHCTMGLIMRDLGNLQEAEVSIRKAIELNPDYPMAYLNLGMIFTDLGNLQEAEITTRKAIELNPDFAYAHSNLGSILRDLGKLKKAELSLRKAIELEADCTQSYYSLSLLKYSDNNTIWKDQLFSENILINKSKIAQVDIYFARANVLHKEKKYKESSRSFELANKLKLIIKPSNSKGLINQSKNLLIESDKKDIYQGDKVNYPQSIFIVGMPRSGSTLLESVLSLNPNVKDLGEINILEESFLEWEKDTQELPLSERYWEKIISQKSESNITTNKWLYNYQYAGIISTQLPNAKIIHCFRNPLDNILSIYRTHFARGNNYSSSLVDCTNVYLDQEKTMTKYKKRFRSKIYDLNYDLLVSKPDQEIKSLISWLSWEWNDAYLSPHLNSRSVSTASSVQVRSPINSKSIGGWKNYKEMLKPAIEILTQTDRYQDIVS